MSNIIDSIQVSGVTYGIKGSGGTETIELTQAQYDALVDKDPNTFYVITDAEAGDLTNYYTKTETDNAITAATSTKQDTLVSGTNIKTINNTSILGSGNIDIQGGGGSSYTAGDGIDITNNVISVTGKVDTSTYTTYTAATDTTLASKQTTLTAGTGISIVDNVISATGGGGGGKAIEAGRGISITTGATADTVSFNLPISANTNNSIVMGGKINNSFTNNGRDCLMVGSEDTISNGSDCSLIVGYRCSVNGDASAVIGWNSSSTGDGSFAFGTSVSVTASDSFATGNHTITKNNYEHTSGKYNVSNTGSTTADKTLFSVGNGTSDSARHNAFEIRQNGDIYLSDGTNDVKLQDYIQIKAVKITQSDYDQLQTKDPNTLYCIVN